MKYPQPLTRIHQIELSSRCNLACVYCPHPKMQRPKIDMSLENFTLALDWVTYFARRLDRGQSGSTQTELSLTGIGEALLHPDLSLYLGAVRDIFHKKVILATNGLAVTPEICELLREYDIEVWVSLHRPEKAGPAIDLLINHGVSVGFNNAFATSSLNWAGTVNWYVSAPKTMCKYLDQGWGTVLADGSITTCCMDSEGLGIVGHVRDLPGTVSVKPYSLCSSCHLEVPT